MSTVDVSLLEKFNKDRLGDKAYSDIQIKVKDELFHGHRFLLGSTSGYFDRLFRSKFKNKFDKVIVVKGPLDDEIAPSTMNIILIYIYTESITLDEEDIFSVIRAAEFLDIPQLVCTCVEYLLESISPTTWLSTYRISQHLNKANLHQACLDHFQKVYSFLDYSVFIFSELKEVLEQNQSFISSSAVYKVITDWISFDYEDRDVHFDELLEFIDFKMMDMQFLKKQVLTQKIVTSRPEVLVKISNMLVDMMMCKSQQAPERNENTLLVVGGNDSESETSVARFKTSSVYQIS